MDSGGSGATASRNQRYTYLVGRLRTRQITMEEATELFSIQQAALTRAEAARLAALAQASAASASSSSAPLPPPPPRVGPSAGGSDDFLILGLLTMGAGAGLLAAMTQKIQQGTVAPTGTANKKPLPK